jgi:class 3 adenylate cyclase
MAEKYAVELALPGNEANNNNNNNNENMTFLLAKDAGLIPRSVRLEIAAKGTLQDAPSKQLVEQALLLSDISGFTALGEKLTAEHGDAKGAEEFANQMSKVISALVNVTHRYEGEVVKIAGDCLICTFGAIPSDPEDRGDEKAFERAKECSLEMLKVVKETNPDLDLHGGLAGTAPLQRIHLKELRGSSPRSNSARQRMKKKR